LTKLSLLNVIPEKKYPYLQLLEDAYLRDCCTVQILLDFSDTKVPSRYSYYLRDIMELNQNGRAQLRNAENNNLSSNDVTKLLVSLFHHAIDGKPQQQRNNNNNTSIISKIGSSIINQFGKRNKALSVMDSVYLLVRENPWICSSAAAAAIPTTTTSTSTSTPTLTTTPTRREMFRNLRQKVNSSLSKSTINILQNALFSSASPTIAMAINTTNQEKNNNNRQQPQNNNNNILSLSRNLFFKNNKKEKQQQQMIVRYYCDDYQYHPRI